MEHGVLVVLSQNCKIVKWNVTKAKTVIYYNKSINWCTLTPTDRRSIYTCISNSRSNQEYISVIMRPLCFIRGTLHRPCW